MLFSQVSKNKKSNFDEKKRGPTHHEDGEEYTAFWTTDTDVKGEKNTTSKNKKEEIDRVKSPEAISEVSGDDALKKEFQRIRNEQEFDFKGPNGPYVSYSAPEKEKLDAIMRGCDLIWPQVQELYSCFRDFDLFGKGVIDAFSIKHVSQFTGREISEEEGHDIIKELDATGEGVIDFFDFLRAMSGVTKEPLDDWDLKQVFKVFDVDDDSFISPPEMHRAFLTLGIDLTKQEINDIFESFDDNTDGLIAYEEFVGLIEQAHKLITLEETKKIEEFERQQKKKEEAERLEEEEELAARALRTHEMAGRHTYTGGFGSTI